jgi:hypothetical protein
MKAVLSFPDVSVVKSTSSLASASADTNMELTDRIIRRDVDDQLLVQGKLLSGDTASAIFVVNKLLA